MNSSLNINFASPASPTPSFTEGMDEERKQEIGGKRKISIPDEDPVAQVWKKFMEDLPDMDQLLKSESIEDEEEKKKRLAEERQEKDEELQQLTHPVNVRRMEEDMNEAFNYFHKGRRHFLKKRLYTAYAELLAPIIGKFLNLCCFLKKKISMQGSTLIFVGI